MVKDLYQNNLYNYANFLDLGTKNSLKKASLKNDVQDFTKNNNDVKFCVNCGEMLQETSQMQGQQQSQATCQPQGQLQSQSQGQQQSQETSQMQGQPLDISPLQGIYMQRKEPIANELPKSSVMSILIGGILGLLFGILASDQGIGTIILMVVFGIVVGFSIWFERGVAKLKNLDIKRFYLPRESDNNEIFELMLRLCSHDSMKVEQMKNGIVRVSRDEIRYDIYLDNKSCTSDNRVFHIRMYYHSLCYKQK